MYPRNAASPERISIGAVVQASDGAVQTSGVAVKVLPHGGTEASGGGTISYTADGVVCYVPTQSETNYTSFVLVASKSGCFPVEKTIVTTASDVAGYAGADWSKINAPTTTVNLSGTTVGTAAALGTQAKSDVKSEVDTALADAGVTSTRQGKLDNIPASTVASQADVLAINQSASRRIVLFTSFNYEIPSSGSDTYEIELRTNDPDGAAETPSAVTLTASGNSGSYDARISASSNPATGVTRWTFTVQSTDVSEQVRLRVSATLADATFTASAYPNLTNVDAQDFTSSDRTKLDAVYAKLPSASYLTGTASSNGSGYSTVTTGDIATQSQVGAAAALNAYDAATGTDVSAVETKVDTIDGLIDQIIAEVVSSQSMPGQGAPPASLKLATAIMYLYKQFRNKKTQTNSEYKLFADNGTTVDQKSTVSDDGTTTTVGEMDTGA